MSAGRARSELLDAEAPTEADVEVTDYDRSLAGESLRIPTTPWDLNGIWIDVYEDLTGSWRILLVLMILLGQM